MTGAAGTGTGPLALTAGDNKAIGIGSAGATGSGAVTITTGDARTIGIGGAAVGAITTQSVSTIGSTAGTINTISGATSVDINKDVNGITNVNTGTSSG